MANINYTLYKILKKKIRSGEITEDDIKQADYKAKIKEDKVKKEDG